MADWMTATAEVITGQLAESFSSAAMASFARRKTSPPQCWGKSVAACAEFT